MRGRPKNISDSKLADDLARAMESENLNQASLSRILGVSPATMARAVNSRTFSKSLRGAANRWLETVISAGQSSELSIDDALQILREIDKKLPAVLETLSTALDERIMPSGESP